MTQRPASALLSARVPPYAPLCGLGFLKACWFEVVRIPSRSPGLQEQIPLKRWDREAFCTADLRSTWQCHTPLAIPTSTQPRTAGSVACKHPSPGQGCALGEAVRRLGANFKKALTLGAARTQGSTPSPSGLGLVLACPRAPDVLVSVTVGGASGSWATLCY